MICPQCGSEYRDGFTQCADCDVALVEPDPDAEQGEPEIELVKVYEGGNPAVMILVESLLRDAGIEFLSRGRALQQLFGVGAVYASRSNDGTGPVEYWVRRDDEDEARALLATLEEPIGETPN